MVVEISSAELTTIVDEIFSSMAGMQLLPCGSVVGIKPGEEYVASAVQIVGDWQGAVRLDIELELARRPAPTLPA